MPTPPQSRVSLTVAAVAPPGHSGDKSLRPISFVPNFSSCPLLLPLSLTLSLSVDRIGGAFAGARPRPSSGAWEHSEWHAVAGARRGPNGVSEQESCRRHETHRGEGTLAGHSLLPSTFSVLASPLSHPTAGAAGGTETSSSITA